MVIGLEPGDEVRGAVLVCHLAEAHEGVHLVRVAPHRFGELLAAAHLGIGLVLHEARSALEPPQHPVEQAEPRRIGVQRGVAGDLEETLAGAHRRGIGRG